VYSLRTPEPSSFVNLDYKGFYLMHQVIYNEFQYNLVLWGHLRQTFPTSLRSLVSVSTGRLALPTVPEGHSASHEVRKLRQGTEY
jgi:hypothetical protein